jgi:L-ribulose-5-phosphate 4-epimerase
VTQYLDQKQSIHSTCTALVRDGILMTTGGNLSARIPHESKFVITPSNTDYTTMSIDDICVLDFELHQIEGRLSPSVESGLHAAIYQERPDVHAVIHTHQVYSSALAILNRSIPSLFDEQARYLGRQVKVVPYAPSGTKMLQNKVARFAKDRSNAYLLRSHGALVLGENIDRAVNNVKLLEKCAIAYLLALSTGEKVYKTPLWVREIAVSKLRKAQKDFEG